MKARKHNNIVGSIIALQFGICMGLAAFAINPHIRSAAMTWAIIIVPMTFGFMRIEEER